MLAIFLAYPDNSWDALPTSYTNCPIFNLDSHFIGQNFLESDDQEQISPNSSNEKDSVSAEMGEEESSLDSAATKARQVLRDLMHVTYNCDDYPTINNLKKEVLKLQRQFCNSTGTIGIQKKYRQRRRYVYKRAKLFTKLRRRRKRKRSERVGAVADIQKSHVNVNVSVDTGKI